MAALAIPSGGSEVALRELWKRHRAGDEAARERLILNYAPMVKVIAGRLRSRMPAHIEVDDLISAGLSGLLSAIQRFDPEVGVSFKTFAEFRVRGAMIDALRSLDWVPRSVRVRAREIESVGVELRARLGRVPEEGELAAGLHIDVDELRRLLLEIDEAQVYSFEEPLGSEEAFTLLDTEPSHAFTDPQQALDDDEAALRRKAQLADAIGELPQPQQFVLGCRYERELRLGEIAEVMGLGESRISQLHTLALVNLKAAFSQVPGSAEELMGVDSWS